MKAEGGRCGRAFISIKPGPCWIAMGMLVCSKKERMGWFVLPIAVEHRLGSGHECKCAEAPVNPGRAEGGRGSASAFQTLIEMHQ